MNEAMERIKPETARETVIKAGIPEEHWDFMLENQRQGDMLRSLMCIARGDERELIEIYNHQRELSGQLPVARHIIEVICPSEEDLAEYLMR